MIIIVLLKISYQFIGQLFINLFLYHLNSFELLFTKNYLNILLDVILNKFLNLLLIKNKRIITATNSQFWYKL
ncbi:MAG: hypothetical protein K0S93_196 [Nitrososphaeraceae archaeon]|jgi:hypothetical protein|nr:hypothetical protein [Nitrososphaeraceae archaeon]